MGADILDKVVDAYFTNEPKKAAEFAKQGLAISKKLGYKRGMANAYQWLGRLEVANGNNGKAMKNLFTASAAVVHVLTKHNFFGS